MPESIGIRRLGPLPDLTVQPRPLTIFIGQQATGKSLLAQFIYLFRGLKIFVGKLYKEEMKDTKDWEEKILRQLADGLRGVPIGYFARGTARLAYKNDNGQEEWVLSIYRNNRRVRPNKALRESMSRWVEAWEQDKTTLKDVGRVTQIFIPTERSIFTRFFVEQPSVLFAEYQPLTVREFADVLSRAYEVYRIVEQRRRSGDLNDPRWKKKREAFEYLRSCQARALSGVAYVPSHGPPEWKWRVQDKSESVLPITCISSGQMETWPFFAVASTFGVFRDSIDFYFEEPETHLHPSSQVEIMKAIVYLVNRGHRFIVTTHSPYILFALNNMLQAYQTLHNDDNNIDIPRLNPDKVAVYRFSDTIEDVLDRRDTFLIDTTELERIADELGSQFDHLLDLNGMANELDP